MNWIDAIILVVVLAIVGGVIAINIISHKKGNGGTCSKCAYAKDCQKLRKKVETTQTKKQHEDCPCCKNKQEKEN